MIQKIDRINPKLVLSKVKPKIKDEFIPKEEPGVNKTIKLEYFHDAWYSLASWRRERRKWAMYYNGDQLSELIEGDDGKYITESEHISSQGKVPLKQNVIKPVCNSIVGQFRSDRGKNVILSRGRDRAKESEMLSNALQAALDYNDIKEIDAAALVEKLISGMPIQRITYGYYPTDRKYDIKIDNINPNHIFFNSDVEDERWHDLRLIGRIIDTTYDNLLIAFGRTKEKAAKIKEIYGSRDRYQYLSNFQAFDPNKKYSMNFYVPDDPGKCRVIEAWELKLVKTIVVHDWMDGTEKEFDGTMKDVQMLNQYRLEKYRSAGIPDEDVPLLEAWEEYKQRWFYGFYSPYGEVLDEGETPYWHGSHPFVLAPNLSVDGKMTGLVHDLYDQQRQVNRLITLQDFILGTSAKNTLIIDEASLNGQNPEDIADDYRRVGGVIVLKLKDGAKAPFEIGKNAANLGINDMLQMQLKLIENISGVHPAMQGQKAPAGTPASAIAQEAQNSSMNLKPILESFNTFRKDRNEKVLKSIQQFYNEKRWLLINGAGFNNDPVEYDPEAVRDVECNLVIAQSADSPIYRGVIDAELKEFLMAGLINFETYLQHTSLPFAETLLEALKNNENPEGQQEAMMNIQNNPALQGNPKAMELLQKGIMGR